MEQLTDIPNEDVVIKISYCNECKGIVRNAIKHMMTKSSIKEFSKEVMEHNLSVKEVPYLKYDNKAKWCKCK